MKGSFEIHWEVPGRLVRDIRTPMTELYAESESEKAISRYKELRDGQFNYNIRLMLIQRFCAESKNKQ